MPKTSKEKWQEFRASMQAEVDWDAVGQKILGLKFIGSPTQDGWVSCESIDGHDDNPSACYNIFTGYYKDHRDGAKAISAYDVMYELGLADSFQAAQGKIAAFFKIPMPAIAKGDITYGVVWQEWKEHFANMFCAQREGITPEALRLADARFCVWNKHPAVAFPVHNTRMPYDVVGWMFLPRTMKTFNLGDREAKTICKTYSDAKGFVCSYSTIDKIMNNTGLDIYWTEGAPDMLAGLSKFPDALWVTNPHGCGESVSSLQRYAVETGGHRWFYICDADEPGVAGASKRAHELKQLRVFCPPYEVTPDKGKDYRDYLNERQITQPLEGMRERVDEIEDVVQRERAAKLAEMEALQEREIKQARKMLEQLGLHVLIVDPEGEVTIYSENTKKTKEVQQISRIQYDDMVQFLGYPFKYNVFRKPEDMVASERNGFLFQDFKTALALITTDNIYRDIQRIGAGIWQVEGRDRDKIEELVIVKAGEAFKYSGGHKLIKMQSPMIERMVADLSVKTDWFNVRTVDSLLSEAHNVDWRRAVYAELYNLISQWNWEDPRMRELACGLYLASWIQALFDWRPIVTLTGESNSGKTVLMKLLNDLYLGLASFSARSTAAGVMQSLGICSRPCLLDEFDNGTEQVGLLERFRVASRGQESLYGTANQGGKSYQIRHIAWLGGIHAASRSQADMNRMINLRILQASGNKRTIERTAPSVVRRLGHKLLAGVLVTALDSVAMTQELAERQGEGEENIQSRYRESYSVPYGCLGAFLGLDVAEADSIMGEYLRGPVKAEVDMLEAVNDQEALLLDIMSSEVRMPSDGSSPTDTASIAEILFLNDYRQFRDLARTKGVGFIVSKGTARKQGIKVAFIGRRMISKGGLLRGTEWQSVAGIHQILQRLPKRLCPKKEKQQVGGVLSTCVTLDYEALRDWCSGHKEVLGI